jgi:aspartate kinase
MRTIVQKYGGSSVADVEKIRRVAQKVKARRDEGFQLVVVVSAMGDTTDDLLALAKQVSADPPRRELDMLLTCGERISMALLCMALHELEIPAVSFTGSQSGIITDDRHSQARIVEVRPFRLEEALRDGKVVIVAGYQGVSVRKEVTTLGRGGSDTTAVALAAALNAEACEIYSDVDGVYSADPRVVPEAQRLAELSYDEMQTLASAGAKVLNAQAVEFARERGIVIHARSSFGGGEGSRVRDLPAHPASRTVKAVATESDLAVVVCTGDASLLATVLDFLQSRGASAKMLSYEGGPRPTTYLAAPLQDAHGLESLQKDLETRFAGAVRLELGLGSVTCVGTGVGGAEASRAVLAAQSLSIPIRAVHLTPLQISLLVPREPLAELTRRLHREFLSV